MNYMFCGCSFNYLPDISKWNTSNVKNISYIFKDLNSIISLPDISNWNTSNINDMS